MCVCVCVCVAGGRDGASMPVPQYTPSDDQASSTLHHLSFGPLFFKQTKIILLTLMYNIDDSKMFSLKEGEIGGWE